jgi:hypothetical protein
MLKTARHIVQLISTAGDSAKVSCLLMNNAATILVAIHAHY